MSPAPAPAAPEMLTPQADATPPDASHRRDVYPPPDLDSPQFTLRALLTGLVLGGVLSSCNVYTGLTIGWGLNMSITAILLSYAFWGTLRGTLRTRPWGMLENNISQTTCSSAAAVSSAGLVAPIPALTMLTGETLPWFSMAIWVFSVCLVGIVVAIPLRRQLILRDKLPFPSGMANGEMLREIYAHGAEAVARVRMMLVAAVFAATLKVLREFPAVLQSVLYPFTLLGANLRGVRLEQVSLPIPTAWLGGHSARSLTFAIDPSPLFMAVGGLIGFRGCCWLIGGSVLAWLVIAPRLINNGTIRLSVREPLAVLPAEIDAARDLPRRPRGFTEWDAESRTLRHMGAMSIEERDRKLALSPDPVWQETVRKLYTRSQLHRDTALAISPPQLDISLPVAFVGGRLVAQSALTRDDYARLRAADTAPAWGEAVDRLYAWYDYTTTRGVRTSVPLASLPPGFSVPRDLGHVLRYEPTARRLTVTGVLRPVAVERLTSLISELEQRHPAHADRYTDLRAALDELQRRTGAPLLPEGTTLPPALADAVEIDEQSRVIRARGVLTAQDAAALKNLLPRESRGYADFAATVDNLVAGTRLPPATPSFGDVVEWLLWPGVTLMVVSSLVSFSFSWPAILRSLRPRRGGAAADAAVEDRETVPGIWLAAGIVAAGILATACQYWLFGIPIWIGALAVLLTFALALVAARVTGETNTTPVGAMGKVTQLVFGVISPGNATANLMTANVTGGAASQCGDLMHDLKCGAMIGASPRKQAVAQACGALVGSLAGSFFYLTLIPDPREMLMTERWPAPAVATWKAVAELFNIGLAALPNGALTAMLIAGALGVLLPILDKLLPKKVAVFVPSPAAVGLAFVVNGHNCVSMFIGGCIALLTGRLFKSWTTRFLVAICAGLVAGESLTAVGISIGHIVTG